MNEAAQKNDILVRIVPPLAALMLTVLFAVLGNWQLNRAAEKEALAAMFQDDAPHVSISGISEVTPFQRISARGCFLGEQQILIDNIIRNSRVGYFVITALEYDSGQPLLIVNRGWIEKPRDLNTLEDIGVADDWRSLQGRAGNLPRVGIRGGEAFMNGNAWPRVSVYPTLADVSTQLGREVLPYALLLGADEDDGFLRNWQPRQAGPMMHYGYAFQWFALCLTVIVISVWQLRKKRGLHR